MNIARYLIFIFLLVSSFKFATNQCTFWTFSNVKATTESVNDSVIVQDYRNDCEFLCYKNQLQCVAANIVVRDDGTYRCELILPNSTTNRRLVLSPNSGGKHISRISKNNIWWR
ncbi:hypothetical protein LSH36_281g00005 [Paralvinella palmiformis]|uniref:Apple domain-containing protein n=1 Tax=Paralvinella palmiformis TaxID=53620 RepID=A0AAD9JK14_9ANNE|nr:hypothetical protein LSH36_281g00005 [Paralvinella palmiformis]